MRSWRLGGVTAVFVLALSAAAVWAIDGKVYISGNNYPRKPIPLGLRMSAWTSTTYSEGVPRVEGRIEGFTNWKSSSGYSSCNITGKCAYMEDAVTNIIPFGTYWASSRHFDNNVLKLTKQNSVFFGDLGDTCTGSECPNSPIVIPTGQSQAIRLTRASDGVIFDIRGDGAPILTAWTVADTEVAFLALDRNGNGTIDSGQELFGDATFPNVGNGFAALRLTGQHNQDGGINAADELYAKLLLWTDRNHNGYSEPDELQPFSGLFEVIGLGYTYAPRRDGFGNEYQFQGWVRRLGSGPEESREIKVFDVFLAAQ